MSPVGAPGVGLKLGSSWWLSEQVFSLSLPAIRQTHLLSAANPELGAVVIAALMTVFSIIALVLRFRQQEVISMVYAILSFLGHLGLLIALLRVVDSRMLPLVFAGFMILGELAKQRFLAISGYTENGQTPAQMLMFSRGVMGIYFHSPGLKPSPLGEQLQNGKIRGLSSGDDEGRMFGSETDQNILTKAIPQ